VLYKGKLGENRKEKKYENEKQNIRHQRDRTINWRHVSMLDRTQRPGQTRHQHSLKYKCRKSKYIVVTYINKTIRSHLV
jgi:hypothetical protein